MTPPDDRLTPWPTVLLILGGAGLFVLLMMYAPQWFAPLLLLGVLTYAAREWRRGNREGAKRALLYLPLWMYFLRDGWALLFGWGKCKGQVTQPLACRRCRRAS